MKHLTQQINRSRSNNLMVTTIELWHSAQQLKGTDPNIIWKGRNPLQPQDKKERDKVLSKINDTICQGKKLSGKQNTTIYYNYKTEDFVIKSIPLERDEYERISPILSYGKFPNTRQNDTYNNTNNDTNEYQSQYSEWIERVEEEIRHFASTNSRNFSKENLEEVKELLMKSTAGLSEKKTKEYSLQLWVNLIIIAIVLTSPLVAGWMLYEQTPRLIQESITQKNQPTINQPNSQLTIKQSSNSTPQKSPAQETEKNQPTVSPVSLQKIVQKLIIRITILLAVNNALLLVLLKFPINSILGRKNKHKR